MIFEFHCSGIPNTLQWNPNFIAVRVWGPFFDSTYNGRFGMLMIGII